MWSPQLFVQNGLELGYDSNLLETCVVQIERPANHQPALPSILSLNHLATRSKVPYIYLRSVVDRGNWNSFRKFSIRKRSGGRRFIHVPEAQLMQAQRWICLLYTSPSPRDRQKSRMPSSA